jgi:Spy/CpxP family protein refolding chaperone
MNAKRIVHSLVYWGVGACLCLPAMPGIASTAKAIPQAAAEGRQKMGEAYQEAVNGLNLNDDQKGKVSAIFADSKSKRDAIVADTALSPDQKKEKMKALHEDTREKVNEVLTPEQKAALKAKMQAMAPKAAPPAQ